MPAAIPAALTAFTNAVATYVSSAAFAVGFSGVTASAIGSAVGSFALGALSLGAMGSGLAATLGGLAATAGVSALLQPDVPNVGAQIQAKAGSVIPRTMVMGRTAIAGVLANDTFYSGKDNGVATQFYILSGAGDCGTIEKILIGDDEVTFNSPVNSIYRAVGKYSGALWMCQKSGSWTQAAINFNSGGNGLKSGEHPSEWTTNHRLLGCMNMCLMVGRYNEPVKSNGLNGTVLSIVKAENVSLIDPRTGSAATTWAQKQNPWVWAYSYLKNITSSVSPTGVVLAGCNMPDSGIDATSFAYAANIADANSWTIAGEVVLESGKKNEILSGMCQAGGGSYTFRNGKVYATVAGIKAVAGYLTNDHIREDISVAPLSPAQTIPNRIIPRFISESNSWKVIDGSVITDASFVTQDGTERTINYEIPYCGNGAAQAAKLAALALVNSREPFQFDVPLMPSGRYLALPGDCLQITADLTDWVGQKILVNKLTGNGDLTANIHATSETDSKYAWALGQTTVPPDYTASVLIDKSYVATPTGTAWTVTGTQITQGDNIVPCIRVAGSASEYAGCGGIVVEYKPAAGSTWFSAGDLVYTSSGIEITSVTPNTSYNVRIAYYNKYGVRGTFYAPASVTTGNLQAGMAASADIANGIVDQSPIAAGNSLTTNDVTNSLITINSNGTLNNAGGGQVTIGGIGGVDVSTFSAAITNEQTTRANADSANANAISTVSASFSNAVAVIPTNSPTPKTWTGSDHSTQAAAPDLSQTIIDNGNVATGGAYALKAMIPLNPTRVYEVEAVIQIMAGNGQIGVNLNAFNNDETASPSGGNWSVCSNFVTYGAGTYTIRGRYKSNGTLGTHTVNGNVITWSGQQPWANPSTSAKGRVGIWYGNGDANFKTKPISLKITDVTDVANAEAQTSILQSAMANVKGELEAKIALTADAGGTVTGIEIISVDGSNTPLSKIKFTAAKAEFSGDVLVDGTLTASKIVDNSISSQKIADGAVGNIQSWISTSSFSPTSNNTWYNVGSKSITTTGKLVKVDFGCFGWANTLIASAADNALSIRIRRDSTTIFENGIGTAKIITVGEVQFVQEYNNGFSFAVLDIPAAGAHTYYLDILANNKDYAGISYPYTILQELKK